MSCFEKEVRKALIDKGISIKELSQQLGICQAYIYDIFKGNRPGTKQKQRIADILGLDLTIVREGESSCNN